MKNLKKLLFALLLINIAISTFSFTTISKSNQQYPNPPWAPPYNTGVRYYYLPDLEVYYDLSGQDFVYLDDGQWMFSALLPPLYANYDLYNAFVIALDYNVYQPWMHHNFYVSHYPRFYYRSLYKGDDRNDIRGFDENSKKSIYWNASERARVASVRPAKPVMNKQEPHPQTRPPQPTNYNGRDIGRPVPVSSGMREGGNGGRQRH